MNRPGHIGLALLFLSPFITKFELNNVLIAVALTVSPDIDLLLRIEHRKYTHNITFAILISIIVFMFLKNFWLSFLVFLSILIHILSDLLTIQKFAPLYPFSKKKYALKLFKSNNTAINTAVILLGIASFAYFSNLDFSELFRYLAKLI
ncbi:MAG: metal-dependent hydrolase [Archaeoglobaceae archaeon]|nr:metal-dependent hydrolase [Archaeoglobaceae archaeon]MDW8127771.1 metal-dependent hydrolase [Archaeoglobaceae archaeon]